LISFSCAVAGSMEYALTNPVELQEYRRRPPGAITK
jgi:predicted transcriptional regulator